MEFVGCVAFELIVAVLVVVVVAAAAVAAAEELAVAAAFEMIVAPFAVIHSNLIVEMAVRSAHHCFPLNSSSTMHYDWC